MTKGSRRGATKSRGTPEKLNADGKQRRARARWLPPLLLIVLACAFCWPVLAGRLMIPTDCLLTMVPWRVRGAELNSGPTQNEMLDPVQCYIPWRHLAVNSVRSGVIPLWNPYSYCGTPFLANLQSAVLYPPNALFLLTGVARGFGISALTHLFLAGVFMFGLLRALGTNQFASLVGSTVFMFNGFTVAWLEYPSLSLWPAVWLPLILWLHERALRSGSWRQHLLCGIALALSCLGGHPQITAYIMLAFGLYAAVRGLQVGKLVQSALAAVASLALANALAAAQLIPTLELAQNSLRYATPIGDALATALPSRHLILYLIPEFFGTPADHNYWGNLRELPINYFETACYVGIPSLFLAVYGVLFVPLSGTSAQRGGPEGMLPARHSRLRSPAVFFAVLLAAAILVALGTPLYNFLRLMLPPISGFRGLARALFLAAFCFAGLAAFGAQALMSQRRRPPAWSALAIGLALIGVGAGLTGAFGKEIAQHSGAREVVHHGWVIFSVLTGCSAIAVFLRLRGTLSRAWFGSIAVALIVCDLFVAGIGFNPHVSTDLGFFATKTTDLLQENIGHDRMTSIGPGLPLWMPPNTSIVYGLRDVHGYDSLVPSNYEKYVLDACQNDQFIWPPPNDPFMEAAAIRYIVSALPLGHPDWELVLLEKAGPVALYRNRNPVSRARLISQDPARLGSAQTSGAVHFNEDGLNRVVLQTQTETDSLLVLADTFFPGWLAAVDGERTHIQPYPPVFRAVELEHGRHTVEWQYDPASFRVGLFISLLAVSFLAAVFAERHWADNDPTRRRADSSRP